MVLHLADQDVALAQMGPDFVILKQTLRADAPSQSGTITLQVDDRVKTFRVDLPQGIPAGQRRLALPVEEPALAEA